MRKPISKKLRFEIFKRDCFACQYCGASPPSVILEIDHILPVSKGGENDIDNLLTACFGCNRGKSNGLLEAAPQTLADKAEKLAEKQEQLKAFERLQKTIRNRKEKQIDEVEAIMRTRYTDQCFTAKFRADIRNQFMERLSIQQIKDAMQIAVIRSSRGGCSGAIKYFCGVCWGMIREPQ